MRNVSGQFWDQHLICAPAGSDQYSIDREQDPRFAYLHAGDQLKMSDAEPIREPVPPFTEQTALKKVGLPETHNMTSAT